METQTIKDRMLITWNMTYPILVIIILMPVIMMLLLMLLFIALIDTYIISAIYFIIWIINGKKNYWYITKMSGNAFSFLLNKINLNN